jgi:uncharacterized membrane protein YfcA
VQLLALATFAAAGAATQSAIGFGLAVVFTPLAILIVGAEEAVATSIVLAAFLSVGTYAEHRPRASLRAIAPLGLAGVIATPVGILILTKFDETSLRVLVGAAVLIGALSTLTREATHERVEHRTATVGVGFISGITRGATSMGGPPVVLYQHWLGRSAESIRGNMFAYFMFISVLSLPLVWLGGVITGDVVLNVAVALPALVVGLLLGRWVRTWLPLRWFRLVTLALLTGTSLVAFIGAAVSIA